MVVDADQLAFYGQPVVTDTGQPCRCGTAMVSHLVGGAPCCNRCAPTRFAEVPGADVLCIWGGHNCPHVYY